MASATTIQPQSQPDMKRARRQTFYHLRPKLEEILEDTAPFPYTFATFVNFLAQKHCLELLEFILEAKRYRNTYDWLPDRLLLSREGNTESLSLRMQWQRLSNTFIKPGAPREVNIPDDVRTDLVEHADLEEMHHLPPSPEILDPALDHVSELLQESILIPFLRSCSATAHVYPMSSPSLAVSRQVVQGQPQAQTQTQPQGQAQGHHLYRQSSCNCLRKIEIEANKVTHSRTNPESPEDVSNLTHHHHHHQQQPHHHHGLRNRGWHMKEGLMKHLRRSSR